MKAGFCARLLSILAVGICLTAACGPPVATQTAEPPVSPMSPFIATVTPEAKVTQIFIDGDPSDWEGYEVLLTDPAGDTDRGGFDIAGGRAFANDTFLYVLIETHGPATDFVQVDLDVRSGLRSFVISFWPGTGQQPHMGEVTTGEWSDVGDVESSSSALGEAVEIKMPLFYFEDVSDLELLNVRPMNGICCESGWYAIDEIHSVMIAELDETESEAGLAELPPRVCANRIAPPASFGSRESAPIAFAEPGFSAEWFVAPGAFNMPLDIILTPQGEMLVLAVRNFKLFRLGDNGTTTSLVADVNGYEGDIDGQGNVYLYFMPDGMISRITPDGTVKILVHSPAIRSDCDSGFGFGPDGNMYIALTPCPDPPYLLRITPLGEVTRVKDEIPEMIAIHTSPDGRLIGAGSSGVYEISLGNYSLTKLNQDPIGGVSSGGMAFDDIGNIYLATGQREASGTLYRLDETGSITKIAQIPRNGLSGIEWRRDTGEIVGGQLRQGGVLAVKPDGTIREIVSGNGIITPMGLAFSPCGELLAANDDGGMATLIDPAGAVSWFMDYLSFQPPLPFLAFAPDGALYASEAAPGLFPVRVAVRALNDPGLKTLVEANYPSGLSYWASDDTLFISDTSNGQVLQVKSDGSYSVFADGLHFPTALAFDLEGNLYVVVAPDQLQAPADHPPTFGDKILRIKPDGSRSIFALLKDVRGIAYGSDEYFYATAGSVVHRISTGGQITRFAEGFENSIGLAFDVAGNLYVSDEHANGIVRIGGFPQGAISGVVTNASGQPVANARVQVLSVNPIVAGQVVFTDSQGRFGLPAAPRIYSVTVTASGYESLTQEDVTVTGGEEARLLIALQQE